MKRDIAAVDARVTEIDRALSAELLLIRRGGCMCETPDFRFANLIQVYRCSYCGAIASPRLLPEELKK